MNSIWQVHPAYPVRARALAGTLDVHPVTAQLLLNRKLETPAEASRFLHPELQTLRDPRALPDMERAVYRIARAIAQRQPICIFGDSDVDGLTASVILYEALKTGGAVVRAQQSNRIADGYGLPERLVQQLLRSSTKLLILVDCGTNQSEEIRQLAAQGIETIIVDHHVPLNEWARPHALINPHRAQGVGQGMCSAGLAFKLAHALLRSDAHEQLEEYLDLAALGTLADYAPLMGENRIIVSAGLPRIVDSHRPGLRLLCEATRTVEPKPEQILRRLVPRLNASGRLGDPAAIWHLLHREDNGLLAEWMAAAEEAHTTTKQLHRQTIAEAEEQVSRMHFKDQFVMVVSRVGWHQGVMGPLAAQLARRYGRPAIAIAMDEQQGVGSCRSIPDFNMVKALQVCQDVLVRFGGHAQACGLTVSRKQLGQFRELVNEEAERRLGREGLVPIKTMDLELALEHVTPRWVEETKRFLPFGEGNPRPTMVLRRLAIDAKSTRTAVLTDGSTRIAAKGRFPAVVSGERYDVIASPDVINGELVLTVSGVRTSAAPSEPGLTSRTPYRPVSA